MQETWLPIPGYIGFYEVSNLGNVRSINRLISYDSSVRTKPRMQIIKGCLRVPTVKKNGYLDVALTSESKKYTHHLIHRLVAIAFVENPNHLSQVNHIDGDKKNNRYTNLEWCTPSENVKHAIKIGLRISPKGESAGGSVLTEPLVKEIRSALELHISQRAIAAKFGIGQKTVSLISRNESWSHIPWGNSHLVISRAGRHKSL